MYLVNIYTDVFLSDYLLSTEVNVFIGDILIRFFCERMFGHALVVEDNIYKWKYSDSCLAYESWFEPYICSIHFGWFICKFDCEFGENWCKVNKYLSPPVYNTHNNHSRPPVQNLLRAILIPQMRLVEEKVTQVLECTQHPRQGGYTISRIFTSRQRGASLVRYVHFHIYKLLDIRRLTILPLFFS